jgi:hypothetical protein
MGKHGRDTRLVVGTTIGFAVGLLLLAAPACTSKGSKRTEEDKSNQSTRVTNPLERQLDGGSYCVQTITQGAPPATPIHFSNKENESDGSFKDFEADLAGDTFDRTISERHPATDVDRELNTVPGGIPIRIRDGFAETTRTIHYTRSDESGWREGANGIALGGTPWGLFVDKPTVTRVGTENVNGFDTIKYAVDTSHESQLEKSALLLTGQLKDYNITGTAWATKDTNCILRYVIDFEEDNKDGTVRKTHYEGSVAEK